MEVPFRYDVRLLSLLAIFVLMSGCGTSSQSAEAANAEGRLREKPPREGTLDRRLYDLAQEFASGLEPTDSKFTGSLDEGAVADFPIVLRSDRCARILAVGDKSVEDLDLMLFDRQGVQHLQDASADAAPILGLMEYICPAVPTFFRVRVEMRKGSGTFLLRVYETPSR